MLLVALFILFISILWMYVLWSRRKFNKLIEHFPGPKGYPLIGIAYKFLSKKAVLEIFRKESESFGSNAVTWFVNIPLLVTNDPETIQEVLNSPNSLDKASILYKSLKQFVGNGVVLVEGPTWQIHRKTINPLFNQSSLRNFIPIFNKESSLLLDKLEPLVGNGEHSLTPMIKFFTIGLSSRAMWGFDMNNDEHYKNGTLPLIYDKIISTAVRLSLSPWLNNKIMRKLSGIESVFDNENTIIRNKVKKSMEMYDNNANELPYSFIKFATERKNILSPKDIEDEAHTLITAAFETSAFTLNYVLMYLAMYPEYQDKVVDELQSVFPNRESFNVEYDDMDKLAYLELVMRETMRLAPAAPLIARSASGDVKLSSGVVLPKGLQIIISPYVLHRRKDIWGPDADEFNPDNVLPSNLEAKHPYAYIPFSRGRRNCIGEKFAMLALKTALSKLLLKYKFTTNFRNEDMEIKNHLTLRFKEMPKFRIEYRF